MSVESCTSLRRSQPRPKTGIVHLGLGAFFRAHAAIYLKEAMALSGGDWGVVGVSLRSSGMRDKLAQQDFLYTAVEMSELGLNTELIDVVTDVLVAYEDPEAVLKAMTDKNTCIVSLTVTEKGYCRGLEDAVLDFQHQDIQHDLSSKLPRSAPGFLVRALERRWRNNIRPFTVMSLDNLPSNGQLTRQIVCEFASKIDDALLLWIQSEVKFPSTMVDRIVPATTQKLIDRTKVKTGIHDPAMVAHEPFRQFVIEDCFVDNKRPDLIPLGAQLVSKVKPYEDMKLRMLNGTHSALAYIGSLAGHETVANAIKEESIEDFIDALWHEEIAKSFDAPPDIDLNKYATRLKSRYQNPEICHLLKQIAMDGSQKLPQRIIHPLFENLSLGQPYSRLLTVVAAWIRYLQKQLAPENLAEIDDPLAQEITAAILASEDDIGLVAQFLKIDSVFGGHPTHKISDQLISILKRMGRFEKTSLLEGNSE